jgi:glutamate-5-semialdehyde dehydrogenase
MANDARKILLGARKASAAVSALSTDEKNRILKTFAEKVLERKRDLLAANARDLKAAKGKISSTLLARLELDDAKIDDIVNMILGVRDLPDPTGKIVQSLELDSGLEMVKKTVPLGVVVVVFESRPDVVPQITSLILKSGNAVVFKGGSEAKNTNLLFSKIWEEVGRQHAGLPKTWAQQVGGREEFRSLLKHHDLIDLVIPRGSNALVSSVMKSTKAPVLGHAAGVCSMFIHESADLEQALELVVDAKLQAPSTCNAIETLLVQAAVAPEFFARFGEMNREMNIQILGCPRTRKILKGVKAASEKDFGKEFGDERLAVKVVNSLEEAIEHINSHGSHHTDAIVATDAAACARFLEQVDSATVLSNASTRFADGYRLGLGAEVGVSTSKIHARGPAGLESLVTTKFLLDGSGQVVSDYVGKGARPFKHRPL